MFVEAHNFVVESLWEEHRGLCPVGADPQKWNQLKRRRAVFLAPNIVAVDDLHKQILRQTGWGEVRSWRKGGKEASRAFARDEGVRLRQGKPNSSTLMDVGPMDSLNLEPLRGLFGPKERDGVRCMTLAGAVMVDEAQVADISNQSFLTDLLRPYRGCRSKAEYFGIMVILNVAKGEERVLNWAKSKNFKIVTLDEEIPQLVQRRVEDMKKHDKQYKVEDDEEA